MSLDLLRARMQKIANDDNYISGIACYILEGHELEKLVDTEGAGHDGLTTGLAAQKFVASTDKILPSLIREYGYVVEINFWMEFGFLSWRTVDIQFQRQGGNTLTKKCMFVFAHKQMDGEKLSKSAHNLHLSYISHFMVDQTEEDVQPNGNRITRSVSGLTSLLKATLQERFGKF